MIQSRRDVLTTALHGAGAAGLAALLPRAHVRADTARRPLSDPAPAPDKRITRIALGSCLYHSDKAPVLDTIARKKPDVMLWLGDNVYGDTLDMGEMKEKYARLAANPRFARLWALCPNLALWDDHDFGMNNVGAQYPMRRESRDLFFDFWRVDPRSPRRWHDGIYGSFLAGPRGSEVQIILLDNRFNKSPRPSATGTILGERQWRWLEAELGRRAAVRIIASGIQVVNASRRPERWMDFPHERERLFALIRRKAASGVIFVSGDTHRAELHIERGSLGYDAHDLTSSALDQESRRRPVLSSRQLVGPCYRDPNFGLIEIDWHCQDPLIKLDIHPAEGGPKPMLSHWIRLRDLRHRPV